MKHLLSILLISMSFVGFGQFDLDSLRSDWTDESLPDERRMASMKMLISFGYSNYDLDSTEILALELLDFAVEKNNLNYQAASYSLMGNAHFYIGSYEKAIEYYSQEYEIIQDNEGIDLAGCLINLGSANNGLGRVEEGLQFMKQGIEVCDRIGELDYKLNALNNIGVIYQNISNYDEAIVYFERALDEAIDSIHFQVIAGANANLGYINRTQGNFQKAIKHLNKSSRIATEHNMPMIAVFAENFLGTLYMDMDENELALEHKLKAEKICKDVGMVRDLAGVYDDLGNLYKDIGTREEVEYYFKRAISLSDSIGNPYNGISSRLNLASNYVEWGKFEEASLMYDTVSVLLEDGEDEMMYGMLSIGKGKWHMRQWEFEEALPLVLKGYDIAEKYGRLDQVWQSAHDLKWIYQELGQHEKALEMSDRYHAVLDSIRSDDNERALLKRKYEFDYRTQAISDSIEFAKKETITQLQIDKQEANIRSQRYVIAGVGVALLLIVLLARNISKSKKRSDELLLNILPEDVMNEVKEKGYSDAKEFEQATVLFSDFKGFTTISEQLSAAELVAEIDVCFKAFDGIMEKYRIEKIKTIGDAYMAAAGLHVPKTADPNDVILAGLEMLEFISKRKNEREALGLPAFDMRVGIHTGSVVAGIVGVKKYQYDVWGDTVNTASRMESSGEVSRVNISENTYDLVKDDLRFGFESRGQIEAKGKGKMDMYFVQLR